MTDGFIERAIQKVAAAYAGLKTANGYRFDVKYVTRHWTDPDDLPSNQVPAIGIVRPLGDSESLTYLDGANGGGYMSRLRLEVRGYIRTGGENPDDSDMATLAEAFLSDIRSLAMKAPTFASGTLIKDSLLIGGGSDAGWDDEGAEVVQPIQINVAFDATNP